jgi:uncharacterized membrane protein
MKTNKLWAVIAFFSGFLELLGLRSKGKDDTLSEYVWSKTKHPAVGGLVGGLMGWLVYHFTYGKGVDLGPMDVVFTGVGMAMGYFARKRQQT